MLAMGGATLVISWFIYFFIFFFYLNKVYSAIYNEQPDVNLSTYTTKLILHTPEK